jgi:hypothetical protein
MPLEGQWERQHTPLRRVTAREIRLIVVVSALAAGALALALALSLGGGSRAPAAGCIRVIAASSTGGAPLQACGRAAERWCRGAADQDAPLARALRAECRRRHLPVPAPAGG